MATQGALIDSVITHLEVGDSIGPYQIIRCVGSGGMGTVYQVTHPMLSRPTAVKVLSTRADESSSHTERFLREAETSSRLNHPGIVPVFDFGEDDGFTYIVMAFVEGTCLSSVIERHISGAVTENDGLKVGRNFPNIAALGADVADALDHAHALDIVHRDVKPANLILDQYGQVWITDFGLAKHCDDRTELTVDGAILGTPKYMAPEQMRGLADGRSDIYSLGLTLYELAAGERAWATHGMTDLPNLRTRNPKVPRQLADIVMKACDPHPQNRFQTAGEMRSELRGFAFGGSALERRRSRRSQENSVPQKLGWFAAGGVAMILGSCLTIFGQPRNSVLFRSLEPVDVGAANLVGANDFPPFAHIDGGTSIRESFEQMPQTPLDDCDGWRLVNDFGNVEIIRESLEHSDVVSTGNALFVELTSDGKPEVVIERKLEKPIVEGDVWLSFLVRSSRVGVGHLFVIPGTKCAYGVGKGWGEHFSINNEQSAEPMDVYATNLVLAKYELDPTGPDVVSMWVNPDSVSSPPDAKLTEEVGAIDRVRIIGQGFGRGQYVIDELRLGPTEPGTDSGFDEIELDEQELDESE